MGALASGVQPLKSPLPMTIRAYELTLLYLKNNLLLTETHTYHLTHFHELRKAWEVVIVHLIEPEHIPTLQTELPILKSIVPLQQLRRWFLPLSLLLHSYDA